MIKILLVDDHDIILDGIKAMFFEDPDFEIIDVAKNGIEAIEKNRHLKPQVIIMDISMPEMSGIDAVKIIKSEDPNVKVIGLTQHESNEYVMEMINAGADGYLLKNSKKKELTDAIQAVYLGKTYFGKKVSSIIIDDLLSAKFREEQSIRTKDILTPREIEIIRFIANDKSNQKIAIELNISSRTVETHRRNIMQKLDISSAVGLVRFAIKNNIVKL
jgi:two-component system nitrate/nitrite response regulator NarL